MKLKTTPSPEQRTVTRTEAQLHQLYSMPPEWSDESPRMEGLVWINTTNHQSQ